MIIATIQVSDERYAAQRPPHIHRWYADGGGDREAWEWIHAIEERLGWIDVEINDFPHTFAWRCPSCGWLAP